MTKAFDLVARFNATLDVLEPKAKKLFLSDVATQDATVKPIVTAILDDDLISAQRLVASSKIPFNRLLKHLTDTYASGVDLAAEGNKFSAPKLAKTYAETHAGSQVEQITRSGRIALSRAVSEAVEYGTPPKVLAEKLKRSIGLGDRYQTAVSNYEKAQRAGGATARAAAAKARGYKDRLLQSRAMSVARTETASAMNAGLRLQWADAYAAGLIPADARMRWVVAADERLCHTCALLDGIEIPLNGAFVTDMGKLVSPPAHTNCRCTLVLVIPT